MRKIVLSFFFIEPKKNSTLGEFDEDVTATAFVTGQPGKYRGKFTPYYLPPYLQDTTLIKIFS